MSQHPGPYPDVTTSGSLSWCHNIQVPILMSQNPGPYPDAKTSGSLSWCHNIRVPPDVTASESLSSWCHNIRVLILMSKHPDPYLDATTSGSISWCHNSRVPILMLQRPGPYLDFHYFWYFRVFFTLVLKFKRNRTSRNTEIDIQAYKSAIAIILRIFRW